ncbi:MAG: hypothetical protein EHM55_03345 [Acidobacteria bacterium]|nr:MAG: hypothetical protein EHM55_03345 [Acidobacteriota bacterium]
MSGICGIYSFRDPSLASREILSSMMDAIGHRGTVTRRMFVDDQAGIALGHVFAPSFLPSDQDAIPNWHEDEQYVATLDGAIFNATDSVRANGSRRYQDPECGAAIEHLRQSPATFPEKLDGHFGMAVWDRSERALWLARDVPGCRPLYYFYPADKGVVVFASELKGILAHPAVERRVSRDALTAYLTFGYLPAPLSIIDHAHKVFPGEVLRFDRTGEVTRRRYWEIPPFAVQEGELEEHAVRTREQVIEAVAKHAGGAKRVGVYLSGGADSTVVLGILRLLGVPELHTFTMGFHTDPGKEHLSEDLQWAEHAARVFGSTHHPIIIDRHHDPRALLPIALRQFDEPTLTPNCYSKFLLSEAARREGVDSAMSGSCAGPCFQQPSTKHIRKMRAAAGDAASPEELILFNRTKLFSFDEQAELLTKPEPHAREMALDIIKRFSKGVDAPAFGDFMNGTLIRMQAEKSIGVQDRTSSVNGVELRHPFHDAALLKFTNTIPPRFKGSESDEMQKAVLTAAFKDMLPEEIVSRKKAGFPSYYWTNGEVDDLKHELLSPAALERVGLFRPDTVQKILDSDKVSTKKSAGQRTWGLLVMQAWFERYINRNEALFDVIQHA